MYRFEDKLINKDVMETLFSPESEAAFFADVGVPAAGVSVSRPLVHVKIVLLRRAVRAMLAGKGLLPCKRDSLFQTCLIIDYCKSISRVFSRQSVKKAGGKCLHV